MTLTLPVSTRPLSGTTTVPGDKSLAHRAALFAALAEGTSVVRNYPDSGVTRAMRGALETLGVPSTLEDGVLRVTGNGFRPFPNRGVTASCGNSATTIRLLAGALVGTGSSATLDGSEGLRKRPMNRIADPLRALGATIETTDGRAPMTITAAPHGLRTLDYAVPVASAQVLSCLQIAALGAASPCRFTVPGPVRDHTVRMLTSMGATMTDKDNVSTVTPLDGAALRPLDATLPGDISSAAFLFVAAALVPGSRVTIRGTGVTRANERLEMGEPVADVTLAAAPLHAVSIAGDLVVRSIDEWPALAAAAACAEGRTVVREAKELRFKETDRIAAIVTQLRALGAEVEEFDDGFAVQGGTLTGGTARANGDHRLAMSMALCGLRAPVTVEGAEILNESFPSFVSTLKALGA